MTPPLILPFLVWPIGCAQATALSPSIFPHSACNGLHQLPCVWLQCGVCPKASTIAQNGVFLRLPLQERLGFVLDGHARPRKGFHLEYSPVTFTIERHFLLQPLVTLTSPVGPSLYSFDGVSVSFNLRHTQHGPSLLNLRDLFLAQNTNFRPELMLLLIISGSLPSPNYRCNLRTFNG